MGRKKSPAPTTRPQSRVPKGRGRPPVLTDAWRKVTVVLFHRQIVWLDRLALDIMTFRAQVISRAELIRAMIDAVIESGLDLTGVGTEAEVKALLLERLKK